MPYAFALLHHENGQYGVSFPDFPGCVSAAPNLEDALERGGVTLTFHVAGLAEDGKALPVLRSAEELHADPVFREDAEDATLVLVPFDLPARTVRLNITMNETLVKEIDAAARKGGESRSAFLAAAAKQRLAAG